MADRTRNYVTVLYPDSMDLNLSEIISSWHVQAFLSPLHDQDINPDGEIKKPHHHLIIMFDGPKTLNQANELVSQVHGVGCFPVNSLRGYARYLCHLDNPEKFQYNINDVKSFGGADYFDITHLASDEYTAVLDMLDWVHQNECFYFFQLADYASKYKPDWYRLLMHKVTIFVREYIKSYAYYHRTYFPSSGSDC